MWSLLSCCCHCAIKPKLFLFSTYLLAFEKASKENLWPKIGKKCGYSAPITGLIGERFSFVKGSLTNWQAWTLEDKKTKNWTLLECHEGYHKIFFYWNKSDYLNNIPSCDAPTRRMDPSFLKVRKDRIVLFFSAKWLGRYLEKVAVRLINQIML